MQIMDTLFPFVGALAVIFLLIWYYQKQDRKSGYIQQVCPKCNRRDERPRTAADAPQLRREAVVCARCKAWELKPRRLSRRL